MEEQNPNQEPIQAQNENTTETQEIDKDIVIHERDKVCENGNQKTNVVVVKNI